MAGNFLISNNVPSARRKLELQRQWSAISTRESGGAALENSCQRHEFVGGRGGGTSSSENF